MTPAAARTLITDAMGYWKQAARREMAATLDGREALLRDARTNLAAADDQVEFAVNALLQLAENAGAKT